MLHHGRKRITGDVHGGEEVLQGRIDITALQFFLVRIGDGVNDEYIVNYTGSQPFKLQIFDRWGVKVYEGANRTKGWKGNDMKENAVSEGVYFYRLRIGERDFSGQVTLVR